MTSSIGACLLKHHVWNLACLVCKFYHIFLSMRKPTIRSNTNRPVLSWKQARILNFGSKKKRDYTICIVKTKALISFALITTKLICVFVFACADSWFSHAGAEMVQYANLPIQHPVVFLV